MDKLEIKNCIHFGECGGCQWQHLSYEEQLAMKQKQIEELFAPKTAFPIQPQEPWRYRGKMEFTFAQGSTGEKFLGLYRKRGRGFKIISLQECPLTSPWFIETLKRVRQWWEESEVTAYHPYRNIGTLRTLTLREGRRTGQRMAILTVAGHSPLSQEQLDSFQDTLKGDLSLYYRLHHATQGTPTTFEERHLAGPRFLQEELQLSEAEPPLYFSLSPSSFFQPNPAAAEILYKKALELAALSKDDLVFDLYCGTATLGLFAARHCRHVVGIELNEEAIRDAKRNAEENKISNITLHTGDVGKTLERLKADPHWQPPDLVLLDPPRAGLDPKARQILLELAPKKILYISCNPHTQARDLTDFLGSYTLSALQPVDQFPQTVHVENIILLSHLSFE